MSGATSTGGESTARFLVQKISTWKGRYERIFAITKTDLVNLDPSNWKVTNTWDFAGAVQVRL